MVDPISQLRGLSMPEQSFSWWPIPLGWWLVLLLLCALIVGLRRWLSARNQDNWYKQAQRELTAIKTLYSQSSSDDEQIIRRCSALFRRVCIAVEGREKTAKLTGRAWLEKLDSLSASREFTEGKGQLLGGGLWQRPELLKPQDLADILDLLEQFVARFDKNSYRGSGS